MSNHDIFKVITDLVGQGKLEGYQVERLINAATRLESGTPTGGTQSDRNTEK